MTTPTYTITNWNTQFENNRTRQLRHMRWVPFPNKHDGDGYTELITGEHGPEDFCAFVLIAEVASKCEPRGVLVRSDGKPHTPASLSRMTRVSADIFERAINKLLHIGWLQTDTPIPQEGDVEVTPVPHPTDYGMEGRKEGKEADVPVPDIKLKQAADLARYFILHTGKRGNNTTITNQFFNCLNDPEYLLDFEGWKKEILKLPKKQVISKIWNFTDQAEFMKAKVKPNKYQEFTPNAVSQRASREAVAHAEELERQAAKETPEEQAAKMEQVRNRLKGESHV